MAAINQISSQLSESHLESLLTGSSMSREVLEARGYKTVTTKAELLRLGFSQNQAIVPSLLIPVWNVSGEISLYQSRPDRPRINKQGKPVKYETPAGSRMVLDIHPSQRGCLGDPSVPLFITEGIKKADALLSRGVCAIALLGVWNWRGRNAAAGKTALADWEYVALNGRRTYIVFDSDVMLKPGVHAALARLKGFLEGRGADVILIYLPSAAGAAKQGVDDFLAAGHTMDDVLELATRELRQLDEPSEDEASRDEEGASQATLLVELASSAELFHDEKADAYAAIEVEGHWETWSTRSTAFRRWLAHRFHLTYGKSPRTASISDALTVIDGKAQFDGEQRKVWTRVARGEDENIYLDLGDICWQAVRITPSGWSIEARPPVHFRRGQTNAVLPIPVRGGSVDDLRQLINLGSEEDFQLVVGWLIGCLRPEGPYPVLAFVAEQGSGKSASARFLRSLVDPSPVPLRGMTRDERDLVIAARANHVVALDNVSHLPQWLSDALCRMATGAGWTTRRLYTDADEEVFSQSRPVLLTGIEDYVSNGDLLDRTILVNLPTIAPQNRRQEADLDRQFNLLWPRLLGALLDGVVCALRTIGTVRLTALPRMADFAAWVTASEAAFGWPAGSFLATYMERADTAQETILESSLLSDPLRSLAESTDAWQGTASELLEALASRVTEDTKRSKTWPRTARGLSGALRRLAPTLRTVGVEVLFDREGNARRKRLIRLFGGTGETTVHTVHTVQEWEGGAASLDEMDGMDGPIPIETETDQFDPSIVGAPAQRELAWSEEVV